MGKLKRLPEAELKIMKALWSLGRPATTACLTAALSGNKDWAPQTVLTMLRRLENKGFLTSEKGSKGMEFTPVVGEDEYLRFESGNFLETYHKNSLLGMLNALYDGKAIGDDDINELRAWIDERT